MRILIIRYFLLQCLFVYSGVFAEYYSQCGQDRFIHEAFFQNQKNGVFLDVGAHNGIRLSNTYFFEKELGWSGICIEPMPDRFDELQRNRTCICICACATVEHDVMKPFMKISGPIEILEMLSGLVDSFDPEHRIRIEQQLKEYQESYEIIQTPCYNLNHILEEKGISHIHFLSLDTEGGEFQILENFDFVKCEVDVIAVEDNYKVHPFISLLEAKGFVFVTSLEQDLIFKNKNFKPR